MEKWISKAFGILPTDGEILRNVLQCPEIWACWLPSKFETKLGY
jgi:hypothetical protein